MRLGTHSDDEFMQMLGRKNDAIQKSYHQRISNLVGTAPVKVMLGDSTVTEQKTFDPGQVSDFYEKVAKGLDGWSMQDVSTSNNEDVRRIFFKFERMIGNYLLSGHMSIQFHVLLYYKPDQRVIDCQKELSEIVDVTKDKEQQMANMSDQFVLNKLKEIGYRDFDNQNLFEIFYKDDKFREETYRKIMNDSNVDFQSLSKKKAELFDELDSLLLETYSIAPVLIDDTRLVTGEEGCLFTIDIEFVKKSKEGIFDPKKMSRGVKSEIMENLDVLLARVDSC